MLFIKLALAATLAVTANAQYQIQSPVRPYLAPNPYLTTMPGLFDRVSTRFIDFYRRRTSPILHCRSTRRSTLCSCLGAAPSRSNFSCHLDRRPPSGYQCVSPRVASLTITLKHSRSLRITDGKGNIAYSSAVVIQAGSTTSCIGSSASRSVIIIFIRPS
jgi:hypothetical protein